MNVLLEKRFEEARIELIARTRSEATEMGIAKVKEKLELQRLLKEQGGERVSMLFFSYKSSLRHGWDILQASFPGEEEE